ncbi:MAG: SPFH domain-containing protein [Candidatus Bathyarchaeota archaeon]|jgi:regulator of protease activity HflC (stomatin/prohibitin superfamily)
MITWWIIGISAAIVAGIAIILAPRYIVVPPHEAHVVVTRGKGRRLYTSREEGKKSSYFYVHLLHKRSILPLRNKQLYIENIPLRDRDLAKFVCDVTCWINIADPIKAAERIGSQERIADFTGIEDDIKFLVKAVTRNSSMKMDLVSLMSERLEFSKKIAAEIEESIPEWGVGLVDLECIHFQDEPPYTVVSDLEKRQAAQINSTTRKQVAERNKEAVVVESNAQRVEEETKAENEEKYRTRQIKRDEEVGMREQHKNMAIAQTEQKANEQKVEAARTLTVGEARYKAEATVREAEGDAEAVRKTGKADADVVEMKGTAEGRVIKAKMTSEAEGIDARAEAQKKYQESGAMAIEVVSKMFDTYRDIQIAKFSNLGEALQKADVRVLSTGEGGQILGIPITAETGIAFGGMMQGMKEAGFDVDSLLKGAVETVGSIVEAGKDLVKKGVNEKKVREKKEQKEK